MSKMTDREAEEELEAAASSIEMVLKRAIIQKNIPDNAQQKLAKKAEQNYKRITRGLGNRHNKDVVRLMTALMLLTGEEF